MKNLNPLLHTLALARQAEDDAKKRLDASYQAWLKNGGENFTTAYQAAKEATEAAERAVREATLENFSETADTAPATGLTVRQLERVEFDPEQLVDFAIERNCNDLLEVDLKKVRDAGLETFLVSLVRQAGQDGWLIARKKAVEQAVLDEAIDFPDEVARVVSKPSVAISSNLKAYLE